MNIKKLTAVKIVIIGGGLMLVLLFWLNLKTTAILGFSEGEFALQNKIQVEYEFSPEPQKSLYYSDLNGDGKQERLVLQQNVLSVFMNDEKIFETDKQWEVEEVITGDFNHNGKTDLAVYLWKTGSYGTSMPFWIKENDESYRQHLFLYRWDERRDKIVPMWHSSNLPYINTKTILCDIDNDGRNELIVLEKPYNYLPGQYSRNVAVWRWNEWGFENIWRSADGKFDDLIISK